MLPEFASPGSVSEFQTFEPKTTLCGAECDSSRLTVSSLLIRGRGLLNKPLQVPPNGLDTPVYHLDGLLKSLVKVFRGLAPECDVGDAVSARHSHPELKIQTGRQFP